MDLFTTTNSNLEHDCPGALEEAFEIFQSGFSHIPTHASVSFNFEHGNWWATCLDCGHQWSVVDAQKYGEDYLDFESVSSGDEALCRDE